MSWTETWIDNFDDGKLSGTLNPTAMPGTGSVCEGGCFSMAIYKFRHADGGGWYVRYDASMKNAPISYLNITESNSYLRYTTAIQNVSGQRYLNGTTACFAADGKPDGGLILFTDYDNSMYFGPKNIPITSTNTTGKITRWAGGSTTTPFAGKVIPGEDVNTREIQYRIVFDQAQNSASFWLSYDSGSNWHGLYTASSAVLTFTPDKIGYVLRSVYDNNYYQSAVINFSFLKIEQGTPGTSTDNNDDGWITIYNNEFDTNSSSFEKDLMHVSSNNSTKQIGQGIHMCCHNESYSTYMGQWGTDHYNVPYFIGNQFTYPSSTQKVRYTTKMSYMTASRCISGATPSECCYTDSAEHSKTGIFLFEDKQNVVWNRLFFRENSYNSWILSASKMESNVVTNNLENSYVSPTYVSPIYIGLEIDGATDEVIWISSSDGETWEAFYTGTISFTPAYVGVYLSSEMGGGSVNTLTPLSRVTYDYLKEEVFSLGDSPEPITTCYLSKFNGDFSMNHYNCLKNEHRDITDGGGVLSAPFSLGTKFLHIRRPK